MRKSVSALAVLSFAFLAVLGATTGRAQTAEWKQLFNGKDLTGWKHVGPAGITVEDGLMENSWRHGSHVLERRKNWPLQTPRRFQDARFQRQIPASTSASPSSRANLDARSLRLRSQIDNHSRNLQGRRLSHHRRALFLTKPLAKPGKPGPEWNTMEITLDGPHTVVFVNGVKVTDYTEGQPFPRKNSISNPNAARVPTKAGSACRITATTMSSSSRKSPLSLCSGRSLDRRRVDPGSLSAGSCKLLRIGSVLSIFAREIPFVSTEGNMKSNFTRRQFLKRSAGFAGARHHRAKITRRPKSHSGTQHATSRRATASASASLASACRVPRFSPTPSLSLALSVSPPPIFGMAAINSPGKSPASQISSPRAKYQELLDNKEIDCIVAAVPDTGTSASS